MEALRGLRFCNMKGLTIVSDNRELIFKDIEHLNIYIYAQKKYWEEMYSTKLTEAPDHYETMKPHQIERVFRLTAGQFQFHPSLMFSSSRRGEIMEAKKYAVKICMDAGMTEPIIAEQIQLKYPDVKGYDRTTIIHHYEEIVNLIHTEPGTKMRYEEVKDKVRVSLNGEFDESGSGVKLK